MVGAELAFDLRSVSVRLAMKILIAVSAAQRHHILHPKMVGERADQANGLFEAMLDFEAQTVQTNDVDGA
jgi:hypothetical protein